METPGYSTLSVDTTARLASPFRKPDPPVLKASIPTLQHLYAKCGEAYDQSGKLVGVIYRT